VGFGEGDLIGGAGALAPALGECTEQDQVTDAFRVADRRRRRYRVLRTGSSYAAIVAGMPTLWITAALAGALLAGAAVPGTGAAPVAQALHTKPALTAITTRAGDPIARTTR
jgi:hypothetical protein